MKKPKNFHKKLRTEKIDVESYLSRIKLTRKAPSIQYLKELQRAHLLHIPFENLDIHYRNKILLNYPRIFEKIVTNRRGGFCYELNGLFYHLLHHLGFECYIISAKVFNDQSRDWGKDFGHMAIIVELDDEQWLADVGFGDGPISPLRLRIGEVQMDYTRYWRIESDVDKNLILKKSADTCFFKSQYFFSPQRKQLIQFMAMCEFYQKSSESPFTQKKLITKLTSTGRVTLTDRKLKVSKLGSSEEWPIMHEDEFLSKLGHHFGISFQQLTPLG